MKLIHQKIPQSVHLARILKVGFKNSLVALVMQRARGKPLHNRRAENYLLWSKRLYEFAVAPQSHYNKLIKDLFSLHKFGLANDPSKPDNIFYDLDFGFTFIDLHTSNYLGSLIVPLIWTPNLFTNFKNQLTKTDVENIQKIIKKLKRAGDIQDTYMISQINEALGRVLN